MWSLGFLVSGGILWFLGCCSMRFGCLGVYCWWDWLLVPDALFVLIRRLGCLLGFGFWFCDFCCLWWLYMLFRFWFLDFQSLCLEITVTGGGRFGGFTLGAIRFGFWNGFVYCGWIGCLGSVDYLCYLLWVYWWVWV